MISHKTAFQFIRHFVQRKKNISGVLYEIWFNDELDMMKTQFVVNWEDEVTAFPVKFMAAVDKMHNYPRAVALMERMLKAGKVPGMTWRPYREAPERWTIKKRVLHWLYDNVIIAMPPDQSRVIVRLKTETTNLVYELRPTYFYQNDRVFMDNLFTCVYKNKELYREIKNTIYG